MVSRHPQVRALLLTGLLLLGCSSGEAPSAPSGAGGEAVGGEKTTGGEAVGGETAGGAPPATEPSAGQPAGGAAGMPSIEAGALYASSVESFEPGEAAGYNQDKLPEIVLGPPLGGGSAKGSLDVLSLGAGGEIVLGFGEHVIVDGPGPDLVVFENAFWPDGDESQVFAELGEVSVSEDGETWRTFECDTRGDGKGHFPGCAGFTPTLEYDAEELVPLDPASSGGDAFDLAEVGLTRARFVRVRDLETVPPGGVASGFDLDAVGVIYSE